MEKILAILNRLLLDSQIRDEVHKQNLTEYVDVINKLFKYFIICFQTLLKSHLIWRCLLSV